MRSVDQMVVDEIEMLLGSDDAIVAAPETILPTARGAIDFSPSGACFYRNLAAEIFGPTWEDDIVAWREIYREEHRYCAAESGLVNLEAEYAARGEYVRATRLIPIGPWCVHWWERYPAGYRLELDIGQPESEAPWL
jgi:hypothetical protein